MKKKTGLVIIIIFLAVSLCKSQSGDRNSFYFQLLSVVNPTLPTVNYERTAPIRRGIALGVSLGAVIIEEDVLSRISGSVLLGGPKHFFQPEIVFINQGFTIFTFNYKYQTSGGLYLKGGITTRVGVVPALAVGYSF